MSISHFSKITLCGQIIAYFSFSNKIKTLHIDAIVETFLDKPYLKNLRGLTKIEINRHIFSGKVHILISSIKAA